MKRTAEKVMKAQAEALDAVLEGIRDLRRDLMKKGLNMVGVLGDRAVFRCKLGEANRIVVPQADVEALGLQKGNLLHVTIAKVRRRGK
jgi:hypothetical protein